MARILPLLEAVLVVGLLPGATAPWAGLAGLVLLGVSIVAVALTAPWPPPGLLVF